jgi:hypothetical protein
MFFPEPSDLCRDCVERHLRRHVGRRFELRFFAGANVGFVVEEGDEVLTDTPSVSSQTPFCELTRLSMWVHRSLWMSIKGWKTPLKRPSNLLNDGAV